MKPIQLSAFLLTIFSVLAPLPASADSLTSPEWFPWGNVVIKGESIELHVQSVPVDHVIALKRFHTPYKRIYLQSDASKKQLDFRPEVDEWFITIPPTADESPVVVIETVGAPRRHIKPFAIRQSHEGAYLLPAHYAVVHGEMLRYEPQPHKNTVGYWTVETDWCEWKLDIAKPGEYSVHILQGCGKGHGGSEVEVTVGKSRVAFRVEDTGHFQKFKDREIGTLDITSPGKQMLQIRPIQKASVAVMDVRRIRLVPVPGTLVP